MSTLFEIKPYDTAFYEQRIKNHLPEKIIDIHTHVWRDEFIKKADSEKSRSVTWPSLVAKENPIEDLFETYRLLLPEQKVTPMIFSQPDNRMDLNKGNAYIAHCAEKYRLPALLLSTPNWSQEEFLTRLKEGGFSGAKVYLNYAPDYIPGEEIRIFDFAPPHQLEVLNQQGLILMLHIPRSKRLRDRVNLMQMLEIEKKFPGIKLIIAHVGRAYCNGDLGDAMEVLSETKNMMFDISANTNQYVFEQAIKTFGSARILFGSDMPILRMRCRRITENGTYINLVPKSLYGDISKDKNMRDSDREDITFFLYEELHSLICAAESLPLSEQDLENIFLNNALALLNL